MSEGTKCIFFNVMNCKWHMKVTIPTSIWNIERLAQFVYCLSLWDRLEGGTSLCLNIFIGSCKKRRNIWQSKFSQNCLQSSLDEQTEEKMAFYLIIFPRLILTQFMIKIKQKTFFYRILFVWRFYYTHWRQKSQSLLWVLYMYIHWLLNNMLSNWYKYIS